VGCGLPRSGSWRCSCIRANFAATFGTTTWSESRAIGSRGHGALRESESAEEIGRRSVANVFEYGCCTAICCYVAAQSAVMLHHKLLSCCIAMCCHVAQQCAVMLHCNLLSCCTTSCCHVVLQSAVMLHLNVLSCCTAITNHPPSMLAGLLESLKEMCNSKLCCFV
jgi:hypothetical protein